MSTESATVKVLGRLVHRGALDYADSMYKRYAKDLAAIDKRKAELALESPANDGQPKAPEHVGDPTGAAMLRLLGSLGKQPGMYAICARVQTMLAAMAGLNSFERDLVRLYYVKQESAKRLRVTYGYTAGEVTKLLHCAQVKLAEALNQDVYANDTTTA